MQRLERVRTISVMSTRQKAYLDLMEEMGLPTLKFRQGNNWRIEAEMDKMICDALNRATYHKKQSAWKKLQNAILGRLAS